MHFEALESQRDEQVMDNERYVHVGGIRGRADDVEIALPELAVTAVGGILAAPDRPHVIALEGRAQCIDVLRRESRERNRQIETQCHVAAAVIDKSVDELVGFLAPLAHEYFRILQGWGINRCKTIRPIDPPRLLQEVFARNHQFRQVIAEPLQRPWLNQIGHNLSLSH